MAREGLQLPLREALRQVADEGMPALSREVGVGSNGHIQPVTLGVRSLPDPDSGHRVLLISFHEAPGAVAAKKSRAPRRGSSAEDQRIAELERELAYASESMKAMLEEQQASNEELKSTNEEMQSTNEELQSTNEELETSKEELQSVNEELVTVNAELQSKIEQMAGMQDDMKNLLDNIRVGTIFLDRHLMIRRFTRDATKVYRLAATDIGRPLADIRSELQGGDLLADAQKVLDTLVPTECEVCTVGGTWYLARIQPYRTVDDLIDGVVLTFTDVTERVQAIAAREARDLAEAVVNTVHDPMVVLDGELRVESANRAFHREFGGTEADTVGRRFFEIGERQWDFPALRELLLTVLPRDRSFERRAVEHEFARFGVRRLLLSARRIIEISGSEERVLLVIEVSGTEAA
jgi:two-component system CheB/CheR fusion protein